MNINNAVNIMNQIEWALLNNILHKLDYELEELYKANELCHKHGLRAFSNERICEVYIIMKKPYKNIIKEFLDTKSLFNN